MTRKELLKQKKIYRKELKELKNDYHKQQKTYYCVDPYNIMSWYDLWITILTIDRIKKDIEIINYKLILGRLCKKERLECKYD